MGLFNRSFHPLNIFSIERKKLYRNLKIIRLRRLPFLTGFNQNPLGKRNAMNDLLRTDVFTRYSPETVAAACIYLAARVRRVPLPNRPHWFHVFNMEEQQLQDIAEQTLKLYRRDKPDGVALERAVEQLRCRQQEHRLMRTAGRHGGLPSSGGNTPLGAGLGAGSNFSPAVVVPGSRHNSPPTAGSNPAGAVVDDGARKGSSTSPPVGAVAAPPPQISNNSSGGAVNGDSRTDKENMAISHHYHHRDSSRSHSSVEESNRSGHKSKHNNSRDRSRYRSRSPKRHRRSVSPRDDRNTSGSNRRSSKHKRNKDKRSKYGSSQSSDRARSPIVRSKPRRDRSRSVSQDRHKPSKRRNQQSESHKRR